MNEGPFLTLLNGLQKPLCSWSDYGAWRDRESPIVATLESTERERITREANLPRAAYLSFSSLMGALMARRILRDLSFRSEHLGVLCTGGPLHFEVASRMTRQLLKEGPDMIDALSFSESVPNGAASTIAQAVGAKAFAFSLGHDALAFVEVLGLGRQLLEERLAEHIIVCALFDADEAVLRLHSACNSTKTCGSAFVCGLLSQTPIGDKQLQIVDVVEPGLRERRDLNILFESDGGSAACSFGSDRIAGSCTSQLREFQVYSATGGVLLLESAQHAYRQGRHVRIRPFSMTFEESGRAGGVVLKWIR